MVQLQLSDQQFIPYLGAPSIRGLTVHTWELFAICNVSGPLIWPGTAVEQKYKVINIV